MVGKVGETSDDAVQGGDYGIDHRGRYDVNENVQDQRLNYVTVLPPDCTKILIMSWYTFSSFH